MKEKEILVMGIGNYLLGDEGIGVHAVNSLDKSLLPDHIETLDGGTGGFHLLPYLQDYPVIIMVDATMDGREPGTLDLIRPKFASDFPSALSAHDIGLKDLIEAAFLLDELPEIHLITVTIENIQQMEVKLSPEIENTIPEIKNMIIQIIDSLSKK